MSVYSREAADWEGSGYGPLLATPSVLTNLAFAALTCISFKAHLLSAWPPAVCLANALPVRSEFACRRVNQQGAKSSSCRRILA